jgi:mono/diheme cytochrome c family protein
MIPEPRYQLFSVLSIFSILSFSCQDISYQEKVISLENYQVEEGFELSVIASEPFLDAPVTLDFDAKGRVWVAELRGYMMNLEGIGEDTPNGRITILEDLDKDGIADHAKVFLDSLILPRAIAHVYDGLLYAEPPNLWFVEIQDDKPGKKTLVDSIYSDAGNVEHQPNGLMMNIDNWIYNANSNFRYRKKGESWIKEPTSYRGQWGITKDNIGRIYYNTNSNQMKGDFALPNTIIQNQYYSPTASTNQTLTPNQRVYPLHATSVNRGYIPGVLDESDMLVNVTSVCGPLVYRGDQFPEEYNLNSFVCVPEANLIKRNILEFDGITVSARQAWDDKEFIASTDEGFRPVNLFTGPQGDMYIVDMHRGVIQHKAFITQYLTKQLADKKLDTIIGMGRILKVKNSKKPLDKIPDFNSLNNIKIIGLLESSNSWVRDKAQQMIIEKADMNGVVDLIKSVHQNNQYYTQIHALYALEGLGALSFDILQNMTLSSTLAPETISHILILMRDFATYENSSDMLSMATQLLKSNESAIHYYLAASLGSWLQFDKDKFLPVLAEISSRYPETTTHQEAVTSSLAGLEELYLDSFNPENLIANMLKTVVQNKKENQPNPIFVNVSVNEDSRTTGLKLFRSICSACHSHSGEGIPDIGPPLKDSEYVKGSVLRLASVILHGMSGPLHVNNKLHEFNTVMPGIALNNSISDQDIVDIISYLQNAFVQDGKGITPADIKKLRSFTPKNGSMFTEEELLGIEFDK